MVLKKSIKEIRNMVVKTGSMYLTLTRSSPDKFISKYTDDDDWVCSKCGDYLTTATESNHRGCVYESYTEEGAIDRVVDLFEDNDENVVCINKGEVDEIYISLE